MRTTPDFYKTKEGKILAVPQDKKAPEGSKLIFGYDYQNQKWVLEGREEVKNLFGKR